jgi:hypothetical protein
MAIYKVRATQLVYFTVLVEAESEAALDSILPSIYPDDCYEHSEIDWQIDSVSAANSQDTNNFPLLEKA